MNKLLTKYLWIWLLLIFVAPTAFSQAIVKFQDYASKGGITSTTQGLSSTQKFPQVYPLCTVTVYLTGTVTLATIYSDSILTPKANPFTASSEGYVEFYAAPSTYDLRYSGTGITTPFTRSAIDINPNATGLLGGTTNLVQKRTSTGIGNSSITDTGSLVTLANPTDLAGGIYTRTAAQITALTPGSRGRTFYQTDGLNGWYQDYGSSVGIKHSQPFYTAYELGFIPTLSDSTTRAANNTTWTAFVAAVPATGAILSFPEGTFYFAAKLSTTKPLIINGAGTSPVSGGTAIGTVIVVESGQTGFEFLIGSRGSTVRDMTIKTRAGYSGFSTGDGVYADYIVHLENLNIESFARDGVFLNGTSPANTNLSSLRNLHCWGNKRDGIHLDGVNDTNAISVQNCNVTLNGRHGFYNAGASNTFLSSHAAYSAQVTASSHDYHEAGVSSVWILPYAETTGSEQFYFDTGSSFCTVICGAFGVPTFTNTAPGFFGGHNIIERGYYRDLRLRDTGDAVGGHDYTLASRNIDEGGQIRLYDATASLAVWDYRPSTTQLIVPSLSYQGILKSTGTPQTLTGAGAVNLTTDTTYLVTTGANALTLADGVQGQFKTIRMKTDGGDGTLTPTSKEGFTTVTFNDVGDTVTLKFLDGKWNVVGYYGVTIA